MIYGLIVIELIGKTATCFDHWNVELPACTLILRTWGESGAVKLKTKFTPKSESPGEVCMFVGYAESHNDGFYQMWIETTNLIHVSRDIVWLKQMFSQRKRRRGKKFLPNLLLLKRLP